MTVKDVLRDCLRKLNMSDFLDEGTYTADESSLVNKLLNCLNLIYQEVASDYFRLPTSETVSLQSGETLLYSTLSKRIYRPISLATAETCGKNIAFESLPSGISTDYTGTALLSYYYLPTSFTAVTDDIPDMRLTSGNLADGVVGEYYFLDGIFDLSSAYDAKFRKDLSWAATSSREMRIKPRRWEA